MVAKVFLGEEDCPSKPETLYKVKEISQADVHDTVENHIPVLLCHQTVTNPTSSMRETLDFLEPTKGSRVLYILVFPNLSPITRLQGDHLFNVWRQCILGHIILWKTGVYHQDVSPGNMMWYRGKLGKLMGVLNDYDLSSLANVPGPHERTGTVPFMALDLLTEKAQRGEVKHLYRHDLESIIWVFIWICFRYREGVLLLPPSRPFDEWATLGAKTCFEKKLTFLNSLGGFYRSDIKGRVWRFLKDCVRVLKKDYDRRYDLSLDQIPRAVDQSDDDDNDSDTDDDDTDTDNDDDDSDSDDDSDDDDKEEKDEDEESVDGLPGVVEQSDEESEDGLQGVVEQLDDDESESAIDDYLSKFTTTDPWLVLQGRILLQ